MRLVARAPSISLWHYQGGDCPDEKRCCFFGGYLHSINKLGIQEAEFGFFFDGCFAAAPSGAVRDAWESNMINNLLFKAVAIRELISKLPHGNFKSTRNRLCNQS